MPSPQRARRPAPRPQPTPRCRRLRRRRRQARGRCHQPRRCQGVPSNRKGRRRPRAQPPQRNTQAAKQ
eukprot:6814829-Alexandrium_andersonii.AAC.1